jgi:hypothetical protein
MLSKLVSRQVIYHGLRLTTRAASTQQKPAVNRTPEVKYQKVCLSLKINEDYKIYSDFSLSVAFY